MRKKASNRIRKQARKENWREGEKARNHETRKRKLEKRRKSKKA